MDAKRWKKIDAIVDAALEIPAEDREKFVALNCRRDETLKEEVLALLNAYDASNDESNDFLQKSAMNVMAKALADEEPTILDNSFLNKTFAHYRIESMLGEGGMGEVYLATDDKLKRKVALKILPAEYTSNDERVKRFQLEARAISALNHPNIVTIYDIGNVDGINYIATEYVEGKTLRELIREKAKIKETLAVIVQACEALSAAHSAGIIHRDIKPENIMVRPDGYVKILDFGLAKLSEVNHYTLKNMAMTAKGVIIGTPAYMSPEQVADDNVDHRTDLWSIGVVLYELLTGVNPYKKDNRQNTFQAILAEEPPPASSHNPEISAELDQILIKALEKEADLSYQTASDLRADLKRARREFDSHPSWSKSASGPSTITREAPRAPRKIYPYLILAFGGLLLASLAVWFFLFRQPVSAQIDWSRANNIQLTELAGTEFFPSLAPDGKSFVYAADTDGNFDIFTQRVGGKNATNLTADSPARDSQPSFSPDGGRIAFRSEREPRGIYVMEATGENLRRVSDIGFNPSWSPDGKELVVGEFSQDIPSVRSTSALWIITIDTGAKRLLVKDDAMQPAWSPNGKSIAYWYTQAKSGRRDVAVIAATGGEPVVITKDGNTNWNPVWSPDGKFLYYVSDSSGNMNFWRVAVDETSGRGLGEPEAVITPSKFSRHLNFSRDGRRLIYVQTVSRSNIQAANFDSQGEKIVGEPFWITRGDREVTRPELSPDGQQFLLRLPRRTQDDIVLINRETGAPRDLTNDPAFDRYPAWSPDGKRVAFASDRSGTYEIWMINADGTNLRQITFESETSASFPLFSPDGKHLIFRRENRINFMIDLSKNWNEQTPQPVAMLPSGASFVPWSWSSDGKRLAGFFSNGETGTGYFSLETNTSEIISKLDGVPSWLPDSRRYVFSNEGKAYLADTETKKIKEILAVSKPDAIRTPSVSRDGNLLYYVVASTENDIWMLDLTENK